MTFQDILYRAFRGLKQTAEENRELLTSAEAVAKAPEPDRIEVVHNVCHIDGDWIDAIERGLVFIGRAIGEDRQFIRSNGEVQPIERVRHVSRESVEHLSRHSDFITREQKGDLIPERLYTVERLSDYSVYENRFLYTLLCRIKDFVSVRYEAILHAYKQYRGELTAEKKVTTPTRRLAFELSLTDEQDDVFAAAADPSCAADIDRIDKILQSVDFYLRTPIMVEVSRSDKIKRLTKTNVLRMNKNFKEAVTLWEFLSSYEKVGYTIERNVQTFDPTDAETSAELALTALLTAFLVYERGLGLEAYLREEFEKEEVRREEMRQRALLEQIAALKRRVAESGESMEQYMLLLEQRNAALEADSRALTEAREEIAGLKQLIDRMRADAEQYREEIAQLEDKYAKLEEEMRKAEEEHKKALADLRRAHEEEIAALKAEQEEALRTLRAEHAAALEQAAGKHREEVERLRQTHREETERIRKECEERIGAERESAAKKAQETEQIRGELDVASRTVGSIRKENEVLTARLTALRREYGLPFAADDFTTEEGFTALEHEFEVLGMLVREKWTDVKKILRKEFYSGIRAAMRGKRGQKSEAYLQLGEEVRERRTQEGTEAASEVSDGEHDSRETEEET